MRTLKTMQVFFGSACLVILGVILVAGLWPFNPRPANQVKWLDKENGLEFRRRGVIFTEEPIMVPSKAGQLTLELSLRPAIDDTAPILCIYKRQPREQFKLLQYRDTLLLQMERGSDLTALEIEHVLHPRQDTFVTITSNQQRTAVYINGVLAQTSSQFIIMPSNLSGWIVAGSQPFEYGSWGGQLRALAIYHQELTSGQALAHHHSWTSGKVSADAPQDLENAVVLYRFDEHRGKLVHSAAGTGPTLVIPDTFSILAKNFLEPLWASATLNRAYFRDIAINVAGFVPLGFFFYAFLTTLDLRGASAPLAAIVIGIAVSLTIEVAQFFLPTRDSSLTDVLTNGLGTVIGVILLRVTFARLVSLQCPVAKPS